MQVVLTDISECENENLDKIPCLSCQFAFLLNLLFRSLTSLSYIAFKGRSNNTYIHKDITNGILN